MKSYKSLIPIAIVVLYLISAYMLLDERRAVIEQYETTLASARDYRVQDIKVDAQTQYLSAYSQQPSIELALEISKFYEENYGNGQSIGWIDSALITFPQEVLLYEELMRLYYENQDFSACYATYDIVQKRELVSKYIEDIEEKIGYTYFLNYSYDDVVIYSENLIPVNVEGKWGYANSEGSNVTGFLFEKVGAFSGGLAPVVDTSGDAYFIDASGNKKKAVVGVENVRELGMIVNGIFPLYDGKTWGFYNEVNEYVFGEYEATSSLGNGIAAVMNDDKWTLVNSDGARLIDTEYDAVVMDEKTVVYRNERLFVRNGGAYCMIDSTGNQIGSHTFDDAKMFNDSTYAAVKINGNWGYVDKDGQIVIEPQYEAARSFANGMAAVKKNGLWGFIDLNGEQVIKYSFDNAKDFNSNGCAFVLRGERWEMLRLYKYNH